MSYTKRWPVLFVTAVFGCLLAINCAKGPSEDGSYPGISGKLRPLIGSWKKNAHEGNMTFVITFKRDGKFKINNSRETVFGDYTATDTTISIRDDDCGPALGTYRFRVEGGALVLNLIADPSNRPKVLPGVWERKY